MGVGPAMAKADPKGRAPAHGGPWRLADIGGTRTRLGWLEAAGGTVGHLRRLPVARRATSGRRGAHPAVSASAADAALRGRFEAKGRFHDGLAAAPPILQMHARRACTA